MAEGVVQIQKKYEINKYLNIFFRENREKNEKVFLKSPI